MKKIACLSALACVLAVSAGSAMAQSTVSAGYAQSDLQGVANKANGLNLKYRYENGDDALGWMGSFIYTSKNRSESGDYIKGQYYSVTAGPEYRLNDWASLYGAIGLGYGKFDNRKPNHNGHTTSDVGFSYGAGLQFNPIQNVALDVGYEQSRIRNVDVGTWTAGVGYSF